VSQTGHELRSLLAPLRRAVFRATPPGTVRVVAPDGAPLSEAQGELLRALSRTGPSTTTQLADRLHVARSTVSNLVKPLVEAGLVTRALSTADLRSALLDLSGPARAALVEADRGRSAVLQKAIDALDVTDRAALEAALPALARLLEQLRAQDQHPAGRGHHGSQGRHGGDRGHRGGGGRHGGHHGDHEGGDGTSDLI